MAEIIRVRESMANVSNWANAIDMVRTVNMR